MTSSIDNSLQLDRVETPVLLNDFSHSEAVGLQEFIIFPRLPLDISAEIWRCALQCYRLIVIEVLGDNQAGRQSSTPETAHKEPFNRVNNLGNTISEREYHLRITTNHRLSPLFQICHESRQAALQFYRVHIPSDYSTHGSQRCFYLNPEFDLLHIKQQSAPHFLVDFVHDLRAYDSLGVGILNIGIGGSHPFDLKLPTDPSLVTPSALWAFKEVVRNLQGVFVHEIATWDTRLMFDALDMAEVRCNRSYPIDSLVEAFDLIDIDPRPIDTDLHQVSIGCDPRAQICLWEEMETNFEIHRSEPPGYRLLITSSSWGDRIQSISNRDQAVRYLQSEESYWHSLWEHGELFDRWGFVNPDTQEALEKASQPVVGFWIVPMKAFGEIPRGPQGNYQVMKRKTKVVADLTKYRPQLGVFRLPQA